MIKRREDDVVAALQQTDGSQKLQDQGFSPQLLVDQTQGDRVDGLLVLDHHVEAKLVVHDGPEAHDADMHIIRHISQLPILVPLR